ncbi:MAG: cell division protein ZapA [Candidatus Symbiothrix sp.]|jgi:hypothetical protein|nr:cell division protein ZapA [Dysgonamonadaceae bacterium]MDR3341017.1 cell division protein ZapA [Candidatus Symbiothrix sp.]
MQQNDEFKIKLRISKDLVCRMYCKRSEEGLYRKAATYINDKILKYGSVYPGAERELDKLAMAAVHTSVYKLKLEQERDTFPLFEKIEALNKELEEYLKLNS